MTVAVEVEVIEDDLWCDQHNAYHRIVLLSQPVTTQGVALGPARIYDECLDEEEE